MTFRRLYAIMPKFFFLKLCILFLQFLQRTLVYFCWSGSQYRIFCFLSTGQRRSHCDESSAWHELEQTGRRRWTALYEFDWRLVPRPHSGQSWLPGYWASHCWRCRRSQACQSSTLDAQVDSGVTSYPCELVIIASNAVLVGANQG